MALPPIFRRKFHTFVLIDMLIMLVLISTLIYLYIAWPCIVHNKIEKTVVIKNGSDAMKRFQSTKGIQMYMTFWLFNVTNPNEVINAGAKPNLVEVGPFVFEELKEKHFLNNDQASGFITYKLNRQWVFRPERSKYDLNVPITMLNVPLMVTSYLLDEMLLGTVGYKIINSLLRLKVFKDETEFLTDTAGNLLFDGSYREIMKILQHLPGSPKPWPLKDNKFAFFYDRNNTYDEKLDGILTQSTGDGLNTSLAQIGNLISRNNQTKLPYWQDEPPTCNSLNVSTGEIYPPFSLFEAPEISLFSNDLCRKLTLKRNTTIKFKGINSIKYVGDDSNFKSPLKNKDNQCYCLGTNDQDKKWCLEDGLLDMRTCLDPGIYASNPFFYMGSPNLSDHVTNLRKPNPEDDSTYVVLEPNTGDAISFRARFQFNIKVRPNKLSIFKFVKDEYMMPLMHLRESGEIGDDQASDVSRRLTFLNYWMIALIVSLSVVLLIILLNGVFVIIYCYRFKREVNERTPLLSDGPQCDTSQAPAAAEELN